MIFEWDSAKAASNLRKHGVDFNDAVEVFKDPLAKIFADDWHSQGERREIIIGHTYGRRLCLVVFTETDDGDVRLISARLATPKEQRDYERQS